MNFIWWLWLMEEVRKEEDDDGSWGFFISTDETRWDRFCKKHPVIDRIWPYVFGLVLGISPLLVSLLMWKLGGMF